MNEAKLQRNLIATFRKAFPQYALMFFAIENKRKTQTPIQGAILKSQGVTSGVADLCLALPTCQYGALYIELKYGKNKQSENQKNWQAECEANGNKYIICYTLNEAFEHIVPYIRQHREWKQKIK